jgi:hypothetical protein
MLTLSIPAAPRFRFTALKAWFISGKVILPVNECTFRSMVMVCLSRIATTEFGTLIRLRMFLSEFPGFPARAREGHFVALSRGANCPRVISAVVRRLRFLLSLLSLFVTISATPDLL